MSRSFNGSSQYLYRGSAVLTGVPLTMCAWVKKSSLTVDSCILYAERQSDNAYVGLFHRSTAVNGNLLQGIVSHAGIGATIWNGPAYAANAWQFVAIRCASTTSRDTWLNTTITSNASGQSFVSNMDEFVVGRWDHAVPQLYFDGLVSDVGAWNVALSDSELLSLATGKAVPGEVRQESLSGYYLPSTRRERADRDYSGYGRELTPYGAPTWGDDPPQTKRRRVRRVGAVAISTKYWTFARQAVRIIGGGIGT